MKNPWMSMWLIKAAGACQHYSHNRSSWEELRSLPSIPLAR